MGCEAIQEVFGQGVGRPLAKFALRVSPTFHQSEPVSTFSPDLVAGLEKPAGSKALMCT